MSAAPVEIIVNGAPRQVPPATTVAALIADLGLAGRRVAVEINREIVPRSAHPDYSLRAGDRLEIIHAVGGG